MFDQLCLSDVGLTSFTLTRVASEEAKLLHLGSRQACYRVVVCSRLFDE